MKFKAFLKNLGRAHLLKRVCFYSFVFGCALSAIFSTITASFGYLESRAHLEQCFDVRLEQDIAVVGRAVKFNDKELAKSALFRISVACLDERDVQDMVYWEIVTAGGQWLRQGKTLVKGPELALNHPLNYWDENAGVSDYWLGDLMLNLRLNRLYEQYSWQALSTFLQQTLILGLSALAGLLLGYQLFIRRARDFMARVRAHDVNAAMRHMVATEQTEVAQLWKVILSLRDELEERYQSAQDRVERLTEERDKAVKDSEAKSQFLSKLSHELRTPMNGLLGFSALLVESRLSDEQREYAQTIQVSLESLLHVINDVLDLSRIESGDLNITSIPFSLRSVVSGVSSLLKNRAEAKGIHFDSRISPDIPQMLRGDPVRIRQILTNLVSNAIQHTEQGHVIINLEQVRQGDGETTLRISIEDTGLDPSLRSKSVDELAALGVSPFSAELRERRSV
ncbi:MAG: histidine kinase dimerization/phospho-acceptor domain-containing protein, partial [Oleiphilaceae bacterium]|nr:histidine kinase dimerization/phospho-acceptor domain-containing protein [Oleiphilaceae bacterium]